MTGYASPEDISKIGELVTYATRLQKIGFKSIDRPSSPAMIAPGSPVKRSISVPNSQPGSPSSSSSVVTKLPPVPGAEPRFAPVSSPKEEITAERKQKLRILERKFGITGKKKNGVHH